MPEGEILLKGGCLCGRVTYSSTALPDHVTNCYCKTCRQLAGSPFMIFGEFPTSAITWTSGKESLKTTRYSDIAARAHCAECGSPLSMQYKCEPENIGINMSSIDEDSVKGDLPKARSHIFVDSIERAGWYEIPKDGLARYSTFPVGFLEKLNAHKA